MYYERNNNLDGIETHVVMKAFLRVSFERNNGLVDNESLHSIEIQIVLKAIIIPTVMIEMKDRMSLKPKK